MNFLNEGIKDTLDEMFDEIPSIKAKPVYSLKECLNFKKIDELMESYKNIYQKKASNKTKEKLIDEIYLKLPKLFIFTLRTGIIDNVDFYIKNSKPNFIMLSMGFQFCFEYNNKKIFVVPNEIKEVYEKSSQKNGKIASEQFSYYIAFYLNINGVLKTDIVKDIIKEYHLNIDVPSAKKLLKDANMQIIHDDYYIYVISSLNDNMSKQKLETEIYNLIEKKKEQTYKLLSNNEIMNYTKFIDEVNDKLNNLLNTDNINYVSIFCSNYADYEKMDKIIEMLSNDLKLSKKGKKILKETFNENKNNFRYWEFNGRTFTEYEEEMCVKKMLILEKPKNNSLKACLNSLSKEALSLLFKQYQVKDINKLVDKIICNFEDDIMDYEIDEFYLIDSCNNKEIDYSLSYDIKNGYIFAYQDKNKIKTMMPSEIKKIIDKTDLDNFKDFF